ncbi:hypothetical protein B0H11DRAFT_803818 [Mycena galericulata]|nr:hypothetical protein B0H11DRAFT_1126181 [Mycena galericulata]KAJ7500271.1 hypothetical protein B0H11DRAFT_803818 [Mycena galericulata]
MAQSMFPSSALQILSAAIHFLGVTILTFFFSRRLLGEDLSSRQAWSRLTWPRVCILLVFLDSYLFLFSSGILIFGVGLQMNKTACAAGVYLCVLFYATSKVLIYAFLTEKVYIVWDTGRSRARSPVFIVCISTVCLYSVIVMIMVWGRVEEFRKGDGACVIGLKPAASIPLLSYDLYINILLTSLFLWPLLRSKHSSARLKRVATRTLVASGAALTTSTVNIAILTIMKGRQLGWVCLASCGTDVIFNAAALFWVTGGASTALSTSGGNRQPSDNLNLSNPHVYSLSVPPSPTHNSFKIETQPSPSRNGFKERSSTVFKMGTLSPSTKEFQIHVTTESQVSTSPPMDSPITSAQHPDAKS